MTVGPRAHGRRCPSGGSRPRSGVRRPGAKEARRDHRSPEGGTSRGDPGRCHTRHRGGAAQARVRRRGRAGCGHGVGLLRRGVRRGRRDDRFGEHRRDRLRREHAVVRAARRAARGHDARVPGGTSAEPRPARRPGAAPHHGPRDGRGAAHLARPVPRRAVLDGQHRRLPRGHRGGERLRPVLHGTDHRGGQGAAGEGPRGRRGCRGSRGDRHRRWHGRDRLRDRPAAGGRRPGQLARWRVPRRRGGRRRGLRDGLRQGDVRRLQRPGRRAVRLARAGDGHRHHHRADPRPSRAATDHRGDGRVDEAGQRDRRHGRGQRRQRRGNRRRSGREDRQRRHDHRLHRPAGSPRGAGLAAVRHEPRQPDEAHDAGQGRCPGPRLGRRRAARRHRDPRRRGHLAAARGPGISGARRRRGGRTGGQGGQATRVTEQAHGDDRHRGGAAPGARGRRARRAARAPHGVRARDRDRLLRDRQRAPRAAHAAHVGDQRDLRDHRRRCAAADRPRRRRDHGAVLRRRPARQHQRLRRFRRNPPHARHVLQEPSPS